ncbi:MAG: hypothetical protein M1836_000215 [Candelina mexicana]|nr:MAG: hypothetical protein M1836_000215 [Candelina mexicana]
MLARFKPIANGFLRSHHDLRTSLEAKNGKSQLGFRFTITRKFRSKEALPTATKVARLVELKQSGTRTVIVALVIGLVLGGSFSLQYLSGAVAGSVADLVDHFELRSWYQLRLRPKVADAGAETPLVMSVESVPALPGRPGNLSPEQEVKLQEFWLATLRVFGVRRDHSGNEAADSNGVVDRPSSEGADQRQVAADSGHDKKKKGRLSLFGRKNQKEANNSSMEHSAGMSSSTPESAEGDDKYGQAKEFRHAIASQSPEDLRNAFWGMVKHDHPDGLLLRFLRARKWDVEKALIMLISTMHWRSQEMHVDDDVIKSGEGGALDSAKHALGGTKKDGEHFLAQLRIGKSFLHGVDKEGRPMCFVRVRLHRQGEQSEASLERYTVYVIETARLFLTASIDTAAIVFDMTGFSMANMDYAPVKFMIKCFEANYPESLGIIIVHRSPWIFQGIWSIIKGWLDPVVASKVHFTKNIEELEHYVPRNHVPKELGGGEDWAYQYIEPTASENARMSDSSTTEGLLRERKTIIEEYETATLAWIGKSVASDRFRELQQRRDSIAGNLRDSYWRIDPYIRARTLYDRLGNISEDGQIQPYPELDRVNDRRQVDSGQSLLETSVDDLD